MAGKKSGGEFRNDVQGVRTLGALLVAIFHIWVGGVSGGVDVFFVVSGYFLGIGFLREYEAGRPISILAHYERFLCRIVPPALIALLGIAVLVLMFISPTSWEDQLREVAASALYVENWWLIRIGQDYLRRGADLSLVQHFWAVSLIGQVHVLWPLLVALSLWLARFLRRPATFVLASLLAFAAIASFANSLFATATRPDSAYFDLSTRYWQFAIGALIGLSPNLRRQLPASAAVVLSWCGVGLLLSCGFAIGSTASFPGYASLWPVTAAVAILLGGREQHSANAGYWIALRPLSGLGNLSFGIYLWHWPLLAMFLAANQGVKPSILIGVAIIAVAALLSFITQRIADSLNGFGRPRLRAKAFAAVVLVLALGAEGGNQLVRRAGVLQLAESVSGVSLALRPSAFAAHHDLPIVYQNNDCHQLPTVATPTRCTFGNELAAFTVVLVGGSHSTHWLPALQEIAKQRNWRVISMTKSRCIFADFADEQLRSLEMPDPSCVKWNQTVVAEIVRIRPHLVVTIATRVIFPAKDRRAAPIEQIPDGYISQFKTLADAQIPVVAIRDTPWMRQDIPNCVYSPLTDAAQQCGGARAEFLDDASFMLAQARLPVGVGIVDMTDAFCSDSQCGVTRDGILIYRDSHHITASYARAISSVLGERIVAKLPQVSSPAISGVE